MQFEVPLWRNPFSFYLERRLIMASLACKGLKPLVLFNNFSKRGTLLTIGKSAESQVDSFISQQIVQGVWESFFSLRI